MLKIQRLQRLIGKKVCIKRKRQQSVIGYLTLNNDGEKYACWDGGSTVKFTDDDIDYVVINFIHLK